MKYIKIIIKYTTRVFSFIYSNDTSNKLNSYKNLIYSYWIKNSIKDCGSDFNIQSSAYIKGGKYITIGDRFNSRDQLRIECWDSYGGLQLMPKLVIGNDVNINYNVHIDCIDKIIIGNNVLFASNILIIDHQHGFIDNRDVGITPFNRPITTKGPVIMEDTVWIGEKVVIMPNVTIGEGCIIGANSVVTKSFPKNSVLAGVPAKRIKSLEID